MKILVLDNYDSFTYNLVHLIAALGYEMDVYRNDKITLKQVNEYDKILLSPGPGIPAEAGIMLDLIKEYAETKSILGVCLGHQGIAEVFGGKLTNLKKVLHGIELMTTISGNDEKLFNNIPSSFTAGHYHSWVVDPEMIPEALEVTAKDEYGNVMALRHKTLDVKGLQFHPESVMTKHGPEIIKNWIEN